MGMVARLKHVSTKERAATDLSRHVSVFQGTKSKWQHQRLVTSC